MQSPHFDVSSYHGAVYGSAPVYETSGFRLHHSSYTADSDSTCYAGYTSPGVHAVQNYGCRDPGAYTEAASFYYASGGAASFDNSNSYKIQNGQMGVSECENVAATNVQEDNFLLKPHESLALNHLQSAYSNNSIHNSNNNNNCINIHEAQIHQAHNYQLSTNHHHKQHRSYDIPDNIVVSRLTPNVSDIFGQRTLKLESLKREHSPLDEQQNTPPASTSTAISINIEQGNKQYATSDKMNSTRSDISEVTLSKCSSETFLGKDTISEKKEEESGDNKPTMSYIALIAKAILESEHKRLNLGSIYNWIETHYPFYKNKGQGWRNSVRHNLSLNDCFIKAGRCEDGKGNYWAIHPANIQDFMRGDFRQRRRSRRRGRKKDCDVSMYPGSNGYLQSHGSSLTPGVTFNQAALSSIYSPYTEAERRAYRLDEALLRQSVSNPFVKWYQQGVSTPGYGVPASPHSCSAGIYANSGALQWPQTYSDTSSQSMYPTLSSSFSR
ncbi:unnamed protein product [Candidula unifasciata]|uniref:Fork-head domain-containing protein n=1 Tax=Candidula unifasciata TaxID=100452 RepID=A0A8S3YHP6_9EUPU|nr:unnamed protein product [Candidula unifasciata]